MGDGGVDLGPSSVTTCLAIAYHSILGPWAAEGGQWGIPPGDVDGHGAVRGVSE